MSKKNAWRKDALESMGFDGLCSEELNCGCGNDDLYPCGCYTGRCKPAHKTTIIKAKAYFKFYGLDDESLSDYSDNGDEIFLETYFNFTHTMKESLSHLFNVLVAEIHTNAINKGFWEKGKDRNAPEQIALIHSELSEALEAYRHGNPPSDHIPDFSGVAEEMADVIIRVMDFCGGNDIPLMDAILAKIKYNETREYKHGKKF